MPSTISRIFHDKTKYLTTGKVYGLPLHEAPTHVKFTTWKRNRQVSKCNHTEITKKTLIYSEISTAKTEIAKYM